MTSNFMFAELRVGKSEGSGSHDKVTRRRLNFGTSGATVLPRCCLAVLSPASILCELDRPSAVA